MALVSRGLPRASAEAYTLGRRLSNATTGLPHPVLDWDLDVRAR